MLRDLYFYPLALMVIAAVIGAALMSGEHETLSPQDILEQGYSAEGQGLSRLVASPGTNYEFVSEKGSQPAYVIMWTDIARANIGGSAGVFAPLGPDYERAFGGQDLRMTITARQSAANPLTEFDMGYFTATVGDSAWQRRALTPDWQDYSFTFSPNPPRGEADIDYFGIWPGEAGSGQRMDVSKMRIEVLSQ